MKYPRYPVYKDSGIEWIGEIPEHWAISRIKFVSDVLMGQSPSSESYSDDGIIPFLQGCAEFGSIFPEPKHYCDVVTKTSQPGDILLSVRAPVGEINLSDRVYGIGRGLCAIRPKTVGRDYIRWYLSAAKERLLSVSTGSTYDAIAVDDVKNLEISVSPREDEQRGLWSFLNEKTTKVDSIISKQQQLTELLKEKRQAIITHAVTNGLDPNVPMKDSEIEWIEEIPEHWVEFRNKVLFKEVDDRNQDESAELLSVSHISGVASRSEMDVNMFLSESLAGYKSCRKNDLVINTMWAWMGALGISPLDGVVSPSYNVYRIRNTELLKPSYFDLLSRSSVHVAQIKAVSTGVWESRLRLYPPVFLSMRNYLPPLKEQDRIVTTLTKNTKLIDELINKIQTHISTLEEHRSALISRVVTGKIDVRGLVQEVTESAGQTP